MHSFHGAGNPSRATALSTVGICKAFRGLVALDDVSIDLPRGTATGLIGPNGAGKTTLVNVLCGLAAPTAGEIRLDGRPVRKWRLGTAARHGIVRTFQDTRVFFRLSVLENVELGALHASGEQRDALDVLEAVSLEGRWSSPASDLSYGELRRLGVAIALATNPSVVLMDEPGAGLTGMDLDQLADILARIRDTGTTVLLVDHNMRFLMRSVDRVVVLESGRVIAVGTPAEVQQDARVIGAYLGAGSHA